MKLNHIAVLLAAGMSVSACAQTPEQTKGALIGGALGAWLGNGGGQQKEATVAGAAAGYLLGNMLFSGGGSSYTRQPYTYSDFRRECDNRVPMAYRGNAGAARAWSNGCVNRLQQEQQLLEREAYNAGESFN